MLHPPELTNLPVGFQRFHRRSFWNYQLNRAHSLGYAEADELRRTAESVRTTREFIDSFVALSALAQDEGRYRNAASYLRLAEFFSAGKDEEKLRLYRRYRELFDRGFVAKSAMVRHEVPYKERTLPAYWFPARNEVSRGAVLLHGGFDSLIEEFFAIWERLATAGFDVIAFEGPGQGGARRLGGLTFDHDWERPVGAVLDHYGLDRAALVGISMGGYWALRAAAHEPRIDRAVSWPPVYDWLYRIPAALRPSVRFMFRQRGFMRWSIRTRARLIPTLRFVVDQALYNIDSDDPIALMAWFLGMNATHLASHRVTQDVLLMCGENDAFQPPVLMRAQRDALCAAKSVHVRTFTKAEHADQHCQMGNLDLACRVLTDWLRDPRSAK